MDENHTVAQRLLLAVQFAAERHRDQRRKNAEAPPYVNHPIQVTELLARVGGVDDLPTLMAAVLHDTVEDTETSLAELTATFGREVSDLVAEVTDDKSLPKLERKRLQQEHAPHLSDRAKAIKIADKTCNIRDVGQSPPKGWDRERQTEYLRWAHSVVAGCRGVNANLERCFDECMAQSAQALGVPAEEIGAG